jgi:hypothetical protein
MPLLGTLALLEVSRGRSLALGRARDFVGNFCDNFLYRFSLICTTRHIRALETIIIPDHIIRHAFQDMETSSLINMTKYHEAEQRFEHLAN